MIGKLLLSALAQPLLMALLGLLAGGAGGGWLVGTVKDVRIATLERDWALQRAADAEASSAAFQVAWARGDYLSRRVAAERRAATALQEMYDDALIRSTTGRACLREPSLRLLGHFPGLDAAVPGPARGTDGAHAEHVATDTDLARWAAGAGGAYAECVRRLDALIDWHTPGNTE